MDDSGTSLRRPLPLSAEKWKLENRGLQIIAATSAATFGLVGSELGVKYTATTWRCDGARDGFLCVHFGGTWALSVREARQPVHCVQMACATFQPSREPLACGTTADCHVTLAQSEGPCLVKYFPQRRQKLVRPGISKVEWMKWWVTVHLSSSSWGCGVDPGTRSLSGWKE